MIAQLVLLAAVSLPDVSAVVGPPNSTPISGRALEEHTEQLSDTIRCPVCQGSSVGDSPSEMARNMKQQVKELLALGFDDEQIILYFEASYGEFIRLEPSKKGLNALVWLAPLIALVLGVILVLKRLSGAPKVDHSQQPSQGALPDDPDLARWVLKVRQEVFGWPDGEPPEEAS